MINTPSLNLKEVKDVTWLSHDNAVQTLQRTLTAVLIALGREGAENGEPAAIGLMRVMKCYEFVACLNLTCKVLPRLSHLSRLFQAKYVQLSTIKPYLNACTKILELYKKR